MRIVGRAKEVATYVGISLDVMFDGEGTHMSRPSGCDGGMGKMRVQLLAGEKTSRDVASCVGKRQERRVMLPSGVESEDSADTNAEEDAGQMWRGVGVGLVLGGSPLTYKIISEDTGMAVRTLKRWMARLGRSGYVRVKHTTYKRMIIQITKAKKFGPQQLRFPQNSFFAQESKGPHPALESGSKGPMMAHSRKEYREYKPERNTSNYAPCGNCASAAERAGQQNTAKPFPSEENTKSQSKYADGRFRESFPVEPLESRSYNDRAAPRPYVPSYRDSDAYRSWQSERAWREAKLRAELYVGAGPEVPHPPKAGRET